MQFLSANVRRLLTTSSIAFLLFLVPQARSQDKDKEDWDAYKLRFEALWFYANPTGTLESKGHNGILDLEKDVNFQSYNTFTGKVDWKFTRKNHLYFIATPFNRTKTVTLNRTVVFGGQTFNTNAVAT